MNPTDSENVEWLSRFLKPYTSRTDVNSRKVVDITMEIVKEIVNSRYPGLSQQEKDYTVSRLYKIVVRGC
jgi:hypothetical protein